ncbi:MAG: endopeptidase La [Patescibacteria group bacterium]
MTDIKKKLDKAKLPDVITEVKPTKLVKVGAQETTKLTPKESAPTTIYSIGSGAENPHSNQIIPKKNTLLLPLIAVREGIMFPQTEAVLNFGRKKSVAAILKAEQTQNTVVLVAQKNKNVDDPAEKDLYTIGTLVSIERTLNTNNQINALVQGKKRAKIVRIIAGEECLMAEVEILEDIVRDKDKITALSKHLSKLFNTAVNLGKPVEFLNFMKLMSGVNAGELADQIASTLQITTHKKQKILETVDVEVRLEAVVQELSKELHTYQIERDIINKTQQQFDKHMKDSVLRERIRMMKKELGEGEKDEEEEIDELRERIAKVKMPKKVAEKVEKELKRLDRMSMNNPEAGYINNWIETIADLPWTSRSKGTVSLKKAQKVLDKNHYGLKEVKDRIIEYLAVIQLKAKQKDNKDRKAPTILCFVGAPGVGKTSIGKSIAEALGREFVKISLGGIRDEAEIRGHRRTYVGAMPGRIINGMQQAKKKNPVFMMDEIDKIGTDFRGDPSAALLEALDPEQNHEFSDHYLEVPFDLSEVLFITTANTLQTIPPALRDRLEIIQYSGYTEEEKFHIVKDHLLEKVLGNNGVTPLQVTISDDAITTIIQHYTREAGVREMERQTGKLVRKIAKKLADGEIKSQKIGQNDVSKLLGPEQYDHTLAEAKDEIGLATGLAWTSVGGDVLFIEVTLTQGKGLVKLTGTLGDVMKESAQIALTYVKSQAEKLGISAKKMQETDVHIHVPEGAVPKDGPSAGITITTAIVSAFTDIPVKREVCMTGEVTLRGRVLPIGGLKEKLIAAKRAGSTIAILPKKNERDMEEIPDSVKKQIKFHFVEHMDEVLKVALKKPLSPRTSKKVKQQSSNGMLMHN